MNDFIKTKLINSLAALNISITTTQQQQLLNYIELLYKWNKAFNLIGEAEPETILVRHILDSLSIVPYVTGSLILDVGTGAGLPGIPLAILFPEKAFTLLDSRGKKTRFLTQTKQALGLKNVTVIHERAEAYTSPECFDNIVARAVASLQNLLQMSKHLCCKEGVYLLMKGVPPSDELTRIPSAKVIALQVPELNEQRHLIVIHNTELNS